MRSTLPEDGASEGQVELVGLHLSLHLALVVHNLVLDVKVYGRRVGRQLVQPAASVHRVYRHIAC